MECTYIGRACYLNAVLSLTNKKSLFSMKIYIPLLCVFEIHYLLMLIKLIKYLLLLVRRVVCEDVTLHRSFNKIHRNVSEKYRLAIDLTVISKGRMCYVTKEKDL